MNNTKKTIYNLFYSFVSQFITIALGILLPKLFITSYGSEINGLINSINQIFIYVGLLEAGIGLSTIQALYAPISNNAKNEINAILSATNKYYKKTGKYYLLAIIVLATLYPFIVKTEINYWIIFKVIILSGAGNAIGYFFHAKYKLLLQAEGKNFIITNIQMIINIAVNLFKVIGISLGFDIIVVLAGSFIINLIQLIFISIYIYKNYKWIDISVKPNYESISQKNSVLIHQFAGMIFQNTDVLILTIFCNLKIVSIYSMYRLLISMICTALNNISSSIVFVLGQTYHKSIKRYCFLIDVYDTYYTSIAFALYTIVYIMIIPFLELYTNGITDINYIDKYLPILFISAELLSVMRNAMLNTINVAGHFENTQNQSILETVINLIVSIISVKYIGIYGVLIGTICALLYRTNEIILYSNKYILNRSAIKSYCIYITNIIIFILMMFISRNIVINNSNYIQVFITSMNLCFTIIPIYLVSISLVKFKQTLRIIDILKEKIVKRSKEYV